MNNGPGSNPGAPILTNMSRKEMELLRLLALLRYREQILEVRRMFNLIQFNMTLAPYDWILE
jgi:hypothetical protein